MQRTKTGRGARLVTVGVLGLAAALLPFLVTGQDPAEQEEPRRIGLTERTSGQLAQIDVTVTGPRPDIAELTAADFELIIAGSFVEEFLVDRVCLLPDAPEERSAESVPSDVLPADPPPTPRLGPVTYLFYFDQHHLTMAGRQNSLDISRRLIPELVVDGNRAIIVSAGEELVTFAGLTDDTETLLDALDRIEHDRRQWDPYPYQETLRIGELLEDLSGDVTGAVAKARRLQREERYHTDRALRLVSMVLGRLADLDPPKAMVYFADTMRSNAGEHYLSFFGQAQREHDPQLSAMTSVMELESFGAAAAFDRVVEEAAAHGIRLYTVQAEGLVGDSSLIRGVRNAPSSNNRRVSDAQNSLGSLAAETGGQAFLNGVPAQKIASRIATDLDCVYLLSFDPREFPLNKTLPVLVRVKRPKINAHARGTIVVQSESARVTSRLLAAFASPDVVKPDWPLRGAIIPTGFHKGRFHALVQAWIPGSPLPRTEWDLGFSLVSGGVVREDDSSRVAVNSAGVPVVLEKELTFEPGPFELIMVARETHSNQVATARIEADWDDPDDEPASVGPLAILQPSEGAFLRDGRISTQGALARGAADGARTDLPTVIVGLVCRSRSNKKTLRIERQLVGESPVEFPHIDFEPGEERCAQILDSIPEGMMTAGGFVYELRVLQDDEEVAAARREFVAAQPANSVEAVSSGS